MTDNNGPGFDDPLGMLRSAQQQILDHCTLLEDLVERCTGQDIDSEARQAAQQITRCFSTSATLHHRDMETDLYPRLNRQSLKLAELVQELKQGHKDLAAHWETLAPTLKQLPAAGFSSEFAQAARDFCEQYRQHINREKIEFLPLVSSSLSQQQLREVGEAMAERRGARLA
jgi:hemerythrin-like domain-containing protein